jgi:putative FmdB family regulatory protein
MQLPVYVYRCRSCKRILEVDRPFSQYNDPPPRCPECGGETVRVFTTPFIQFVGPGFHVNDYRK